VYTLKGDIGEELFASLFVIFLVFAFIFSAIGVYSNFVEGQSTLYAERTASSLAERFYFENNGHITESECKNIQNTYGSLNNTAIRIVYWKDDVEYSCETRMLDTRSQSVSSMPIIVTENGKMYPGRIDVIVGV